MAVGIVVSGSGVGGVIFPIFLNRVVEDVGFYGAVRYTALLVGIVLSGACLMIRARLPRKKWNNKAPWFDISLFNQKQFACLSFGSFLVMSVSDFQSIPKFKG